MLHQLSAPPSPVFLSTPFYIGRLRVAVVTLSNDRRTVTLDMRTEAAVDSLRILFNVQQPATIPEPASVIVWSLIVGICIAGGW